MTRSDPVGLVVALLVVTATLSAVPLLGGASAPGASGAPGATDAFATQSDFDSTEFRITVFENGSARWTFAYRQTLANESERQAFEEFAEDFNQNETELYQNFQSRADSLTTEGTNVTGREMEAKAFSKRARTRGQGVEETRGEVQMSFIWTNFAATEGQRVVVGDVFEGGLYLGPNQKLVVEQGPGLELVEAKPSPSSTASDSVTWNGEREFNDERPQVVLAPPGATTGTPNLGTESDGPPVGPGGGGGLGMLPLVALLVVLGLGGGAAYAYRSGRFGGDTGGSAAAASDDPTDGGAVTESTPPEPAISDEELLSDDDRVINMLEERGGRMKQVNIVEETGWSKSKVSMLLSDMEEEGKISKLRVGRENIVSLAGHEPEAAGSPFEDEE